MAVYFISGIDTDAGKSIVTGVIARTLLQKGVHVITQKFIQTGCVGISEDILKHREIMGIPEDQTLAMGIGLGYGKDEYVNGYQAPRRDLLDFLTIKD